MQGPRRFLGKRIWNRAGFAAMEPAKAESDEAVADRLKLLRRVVSGESQTAFAARLGIETKRWNNFERGSPLSKEVAFLIVKKFPNVTLDWLWLGNADGMPVRFQRELEEAGNTMTAAGRSKGRAGKAG